MRRRSSRPCATSTGGGRSPAARTFPFELVGWSGGIPSEDEVARLEALGVTTLRVERMIVARCRDDASLDERAAALEPFAEAGIPRMAA
jgi:hypothetical protein